MNALRQEASRLLDGIPDEKLPQLVQYMKGLKENSVSAVDTRLLFIGNSIAIHNVCNYWFGEWGMAASAREKDYVHRVVHELEQGGKIAFEVVNFYQWEVLSHDRSELLSLLDPFLAKSPAKIVLQLGENIMDVSTLPNDMAELIKYLRQKAHGARLYILGNFWKNDAVDAVKEQAARVANAAWISLQDMQENPVYACGLNARVQDERGVLHIVVHDGVAIHPGDRGMEEIARRILVAMQG